ncbi:hypothetical protein QBC47DRAFT_395632 [Echria macrotheca]|uniref:DUF7924 domain-containing protein n=1 Tax=Echria macrotheca TaxID=438768 RepID=A0AAJ0B0Q4_9PEZI|nr:hypothetical protein QBC47DRAFT_395632 [Echria macrotheca]
MVRTRVPRSARGAVSSPSSERQGTRPRGTPSHKSASPTRAQPQANHQAHHATKCNSPLPSIVNAPSHHDLPTPVQTRRHTRKRPGHGIPDAGPQPSVKRSRKTLSYTTENIATEGDATKIDPVAFWAEKGRWPEDQSWAEATMDAVPDIDRLLARKRSSPSLSRKRSNSAASTTPSDRRPREEKSAPYRDPRYKMLLETKGSFMDKSDLGVTDDSKILCQKLLETAQVEPQGSLFHSDVFESTCRNVEDRNEARVIRDITSLIVPSAEILCTYGASHLKRLTESVNEGWNNSIPLTGTRPQPDYSVGFRRSAFTDDQLTKLSPFIGDFIAGDRSLFLATYYMYFPFLTCEVKCGTGALDVADRQNAHSMTLAVRAIVELFRAVKRESEVDRQILAFSVSHDHCTVRIYGHYPVISVEDTKYYRHPIHKFDFTALDGREKWTAYRFTKNVYDTWMPAHFERICSAINQLPAIDFDVLSVSDTTGLSQEVRDAIDSASVPVGDVNSVQPAVTPSTRLTKPGVVKRRKG